MTSVLLRNTHSLPLSTVCLCPVWQSLTTWNEKKKMKETNSFSVEMKKKWSHRVEKEEEEEEESDDLL